jgi:hypothetical protein
MHPKAENIYAYLLMWRTGRRVPTLFSSNVYTDIYNNHIYLLKSIKDKNERAYTLLLRQLYLSAS